MQSCKAKAAQDDRLTPKKDRRNAHKRRQHEDCHHCKKTEAQPLHDWQPLAFYTPVEDPIGPTQDSWMTKAAVTPKIEKQKSTTGSRSVSGVQG